jgi:hypothetical protein
LKGDPSLFHGQGVSVDGYGSATVENVGVGPNAPDWINRSHADGMSSIGWYRDTTLYSVPPFPSNVPWILP